MFTYEDFEFDWVQRNYYDTNPYFDPESWGLETIGYTELSEPAYTFDTVVIWKRRDGKVFYAHDSGCSCPIPFESFHTYGDLTEVTKDTIKSLRDMLNTSYARAHGAQDLLYQVRHILMGE